jgi:putative lipoprotein
MSTRRQEKTGTATGMVAWSMLVAACLADAGCANFPPQPLSWRPPPPFVTGTVFYREVQPLPENASVQVKLLETSDAASGDTVVSEQTITDVCNRNIDPPCNGPVFFELPFDPARLDPSRAYLVTAQVFDGEKPIFASNTPNRVLTGGHPQNTQILVARQP